MPADPVPLEVRVADVQDAAAAAAIYALYVRDTCVSFETEAPDADAMAGRIGRMLPTHPWLVAVQDGVVIGYAYAERHRERAAYRWAVDVAVYVDGGCRRAGVGRALYGALLPVLRRQGFRSAFAEIVLPNPGSVRLHEAMGFRHAGVHVDAGFKAGRWHDIGYWRLGLGEGNAPGEPVPFADCVAAPWLDAALGNTGMTPVRPCWEHGTYQT